MVRQVIKRGIYSAILSVGLLSVALPVSAAPAADNPDEKVWCPYMDVTFKKSRAKTSTVNGKTYYLCCNGCKKMFDKDPAKSAAEYDKQVAEHNKEQGK